MARDQWSTMAQIADLREPQKRVSRDLEMGPLKLSVERCPRSTGEICVGNRVGKETSRS